MAEEEIDPEMEIEPTMNEPDEKVQSISDTLSKYDDNADGKVDHFEIAAHDGEGKSGGIGGFIDRILDDDPELRGQRLWVMFSLSLILVAGLNAYAMLRAPDLITIDKILEHKNEVVAVEGVLTSWVEDPYGSGDDRIDMIIEDSTGVIELRWYRFGDIPPLGTYVRAIGDVIEYDGRLWLQAMGAGALYWSESDVPEVFPTTVSEVAANPDNYSLTAITLTGYLSKSIEPEASFSSLYLGDHPNYGNSDHQMRMVIHSAPGKWLEAGQKVEVTGILEYEQRELRWTLHIEGPEIRTINTYTPPVAKLDWSNVDTWSYSSNNMVEITGVLSEGWILSGEGADICIIPVADPSANLGKIITFQGRLLWSPSQSNWCIDEAADGSSSAGIVAVGDAVDLLGMISADPSGVLANSSKTWVVKAYSKYSVEPFDTDITFVDSPEYSSDWTTLYGSFAGTNTWIEAGQEIVINVSVGWDDANTRMNVMVNSFELTGETPGAANIFWDDGATQWSYSRNKLVMISGQVVDEGGQYYLQREGGTQKVRIDPVIQAIGLSSDYSDYTLTWKGRLLQEDDNSNMAQAFVISNTDVLDENTNGIPDELE